MTSPTSTSPGPAPAPRDGGLPTTPRASDGRPRLAFVVNNLTPYRVQSHARVRDELPAFAVDTYVTWDTTRNLWVYREAPDIGVVTYPGAVAESLFGTPEYYVGDLQTGFKIVEHLRQTRPAAVVVCGYGYPSVMRVILWCRHRRIPLLLWSDSNVHADSARGLKRFIKERVVRWVVRQCGALLVCGSNGMKYWSRYGAAADRMFFFPVEPDYALIDRTDPALVSETARALGLRPGRRRLVVCSRLVPVKAVDQAIDAFAAVAHRRPDLDLVIIGDGPLRTPLKARVPSTLASRVTFAGFFDRQEKVNAVYRNCDVLLHPATWEPWGVVILEAAAAGLAIITTPVVGAAAELAQDGVNGKLVRPNDRRGLIDAILHVTEPGRIDAMKAASRQVSAAFREQCDPVRGLAAALTRMGIDPAGPRGRAQPASRSPYDAATSS